MSTYEDVQCSYPNCCRQIYLTKPNIRDVKNISFTSCSNIEKGQRQIITYYNKNQSSRTFDTSNCCGGLVYVSLDIGGSKGSVETTTTSSTTTLSTTTSSTELAFDDIPPGGTVSLTIILLLSLAVLLTLIGAAAFLHRRIRKLKSSKKQQAVLHVTTRIQYDIGTNEYSTIEESQITETPVYRPTTPDSSNYFVLEKGNRSNPLSNKDIQPQSKDNTSGNYSQLDEVSHYEQPQGDVYQTVAEGQRAASGVVTNDYSHFSDFNGVYNHLSR